MLDKRRNFTKATKIAEWEAAVKMCRACWTPIRDYRDGEYDHIIPTSIGGTNSAANIKLLCRPCHARKTKDDRRAIDKTRRILKKAAGLTKKRKHRLKSRPFPSGSRKIPSRPFPKKVKSNGG